MSVRDLAPAAPPGLASARALRAGGLALAASAPDETESVHEALQRVVRLRVLPGLGPALDWLRTEVTESGDWHAKARLVSYSAALGESCRHGWVGSARYEREASGRIRFREPEVQQIAGVLRPFLAAPAAFTLPTEPAARAADARSAEAREAGPQGPASGARGGPPEEWAHLTCLIDADLTSAHLAIAAARSGDPRLLDDLDGGDAYGALASAVRLRPTRETRKAAKRSALAIINGGGVRSISEHFELTEKDKRRRKALAEAFELEFRCRYPQLILYIDGWRKRWAKALDGTLAVETLTGRSVTIDTGDKGEGGWRSVLSAVWTSVEAEIMDRVLERLHGRVGALGGRLVMPLYDGLLVAAPIANAEAVRIALAALMIECAKLAGVDRVGADVSPARATWGMKRE